MPKDPYYGNGVGRGEQSRQDRGASFYPSTLSMLRTYRELYAGPHQPINRAALGLPPTTWSKLVTFCHAAVTATTNRRTQ